MHINILFTKLLVLSWFITETLDGHFCFCSFTFTRRPNKRTASNVLQSLYAWIISSFPAALIWYSVYSSLNVCLVVCALFQSAQEYISQSILKFYRWHISTCHHPNFGIKCHRCYYKMKVCIWPWWHYKLSRLSSALADSAYKVSQEGCSLKSPSFSWLVKPHCAKS